MVRPAFPRDVLTCLARAAGSRSLAVHRVRTIPARCCSRDRSWREFEAQRAGEVAQSHFAALYAAGWRRDFLVHRRDVDDLALAACGAPLADEMTAAIERAVEIRLQNCVPVFRGGLRHLPAAPADRGVVHEDVGGAEGIPCFAKETVDFERLALVHPDDLGTAAGGFHAPARLVGTVAIVEIGDDDVRTLGGENLGGENLGDRLADAGIGSGNDCNAVLQSCRSSFLPPR